MVDSTVTLIIQRCAKAIEQTAAPNLTSDISVRRAKNIARLLRMLAPFIEAKSMDLMEENRRMRQVLSDVLAVLRGQEGVSQNAANCGLIEKLIEKLKYFDVKQPGICEENYELKRVLVQTINCLGTLEDDLPEETLNSLKNQIRSILREQLDSGIASTRSGAKRRPWSKTEHTT